MKQDLAQRGAAFKVFYFIAVVLGWALLATVITAVWLHYHPGRGRVSTAFASAVPWLLLAAVPAVIILALTRRWISTALAVILLGVGIWTQAPLLRAVDAPDGERITVVQANITLGAGDVDDVVSMVRSSGADMLTVQELTPEALDRFEETDLQSMLPYDFVAPGTGGVGSGVFSRVPVRNTAELNGFDLNNLRIEVDLPGAPSTTVYAVHMIPPYPGDPQQWVEEMKRLRQTLHATTTDRVITSGDFNATWDHAQYRALLQRGFQDATDQTGGRWKMTYPADRSYPPVIAIDHVISRGFVATDLSTFDIGESDHRGLVVSLVPNGV